MLAAAPRRRKVAPAIAAGQARASAARLEDSLDLGPRETAATATRAGDGWSLSA